MKISGFIATTTKKAASLLGEREGVGTGLCSPENWEKLCNLVHFKVFLINYQGKNSFKISVFIATSTKKAAFC